MDNAEIIIRTSGSVAFFMLAMYIIAQIKKDNSIVDIGWGAGFIIIALTLLCSTGHPGTEQIIMFAMILLWGIRLSVHIFLRSRGRGEDFRYAQWRKDWGKNAAVIAFFKVFLLQGLLMLIIASPIMVVFGGAKHAIGFTGFAGVVIFVVGFLFEAVGDYQLTQFKKNPDSKGRIITTGLWKLTRHPNYFGEAALWWGIGLYAIGVSGSWSAFIGPLLLNFLLLKVSGISMLEAKYSGTTEWEAYKKITPAFIPFIGRKG